MLNWLNLIYHFLWLSGTAIIIAAFSYHDWLAHQQGIRVSQVLGRSSFQILLTVGMLLISLGLACLAQHWWERIIWLAFSIVFIFQGWQLQQKKGVQ